MSNKFVFKEEAGEERNRILSMVKVFAIYIGTFVISEVLLTIQIDYLHWNESLAPVFNLVVTSPISFLLNKFWAFGNKKHTIVAGIE
jgi:putative flippase GtrA